jgi:penicillin-binding protein 1A
MKGVTGGGAPATIWRSFMAQALPRLKSQAIPGGVIEVEAPRDAIGDILSTLGMGGGEQDRPAPQPEPKAATRPPEEIPY